VAKLNNFKMLKDLNIRPWENFVSLLVAFLLSLWAISPNWPGAEWFVKPIIFIFVFIIAYWVSIASLKWGDMLSNSIQTTNMRQKITEDQYYRMEARKRLDRENK
jgi:hypothetical protein